MNILNKIIIVIFVPIIIRAEVQRAPGQPLAKPIRREKKQLSNEVQEKSQYVLTVKKSGGKSPEYNINIRPVGVAQDVGIMLNTQPINLSTHESEEAIERIEYGNWRD